MFGRKKPEEKLAPRRLMMLDDDIPDISEVQEVETRSSPFQQKPSQKGAAKIVEVSLLNDGTFRNIVISNKSLGQVGDEFEI